MAATQVLLEFGVTTKGKRLLIFDGHIYTLNKDRGKVKYWRCQDRFCSAFVHTDGKDNYKVHSGTHDGHLPSPERIELLKFQQKVKERVVKETTPIARIYEQELAVSKLSQTSLALVADAKDAQPSLSRLRRKTTPTLPTSSDFDIPMNYRQTLDGKDFLFKDTLIRGKRALIFANERQLAMLFESKHIFIDGTFSDGLWMEYKYPVSDIMMLAHNIILIHLPALRTLDFGFTYYWITWPITVCVPLTYLRVALTSMGDLVRIMSTSQLACALRQLHVTIDNGNYNDYCTATTSNQLIRMVNLHTFTFFKLFLDYNNEMDIDRHSDIVQCHACSSTSSPLFTDHRHVDVHFAFSLINYPQHLEVTQYIPRGNRFQPREIVGATFVVNHWSEKSEWLTDGDPFARGDQYYHHMWYTLPWTFDEFFHEEYIPHTRITKIQVFEIPSRKIITIGQSFLRALNTSGPTLPSSIFYLPHVALSNCIETLHLSFYNTPIRIDLPALRHMTLVNSINCLNCYSSFPKTIRSIHILLSYTFPMYTLPNWSVVSYLRSALPQLSSLRISLYDLPKTVDDKNCEIIAKTTSLFRDFGFYFRRRFNLSNGDDFLSVFDDHRKFIKQLCHCILLLSVDKQPYYSIEKEGYGLTTWF
ncbi:unnamed protein product [Rotaria sp. Silwood2]|nr:unnamed protein product [Rotaria sp. Silwood2]CAF2685160.1 unnamed protein product [Rotaria sp. Silwood2]